MRFKLLLVALIIGVNCWAGKKEKVESTIPGQSIFDDTKLHVIQISFPQEYWKDSMVYNRLLKDSLYESKYLQCNVVVDGKPMYACGIRYKGESSYMHYPGDKKSFRVKFNTFIKKQRYDGVKGFSLNNNFKDPTMIREKMVLDYCRENKIIAQRSSFAKVFINKKYYGLYTIIELINTDFMKQNFGTKKGRFIQGKPKPNFKYYPNDTLRYKRYYRCKNKKKCVPEIINFTQAIAENTGVKEMINFKSLMQQFIVSNFFMNIDAYNMHFPHNFYMFRPKGSKMFEWVNYDYNYSFGAWSPNLKLQEMVSLSPFYVRQPGNVPLWELILKDPELRKMYITEYQKIINDFDIERFKLKTIFYKNLIKEAVLSDNMKMYSNEEFEANYQSNIGDVKDPGAFIPGLLDFMKARHSYLINEVNWQ